MSRANPYLGRNQFYWCERRIRGFRDGWFMNLFASRVRLGNIKKAQVERAAITETFILDKAGKRIPLWFEENVELALAQLNMPYEEERIRYVDFNPKRICSRR